MELQTMKEIRKMMRVHGTIKRNNSLKCCERILECGSGYFQPVVTIHYAGIREQIPYFS